MKAFTMIRRGLGALAAALALTVATPALAAEAGHPLDRFPAAKLTDLPALQDGARTFVNYCLNCHSANAMRYNRLKDIGLTDDLIKQNLLFSQPRVGEQMRIAMRPGDAKEWFGALPPDLSVITRARSSAAGSGSDWVYTFLRSYYRDNTRPTGWNNAVFASVGMPHIFWELQGSRGARIEEIKAIKDEASGKTTGYARTEIVFDAKGVRTEKTEQLTGTNHHESSHLVLGAATGGKMSQAVYDEKVANLVGYLTYMSDPTAKTRVRLGVWVMIFLSLLVGLTWWLNREYWKDVK